jgi:predicted DNA-binding transcriptional regulator AlpA
MDRKKKRTTSPFSEGERFLKKAELCRWLGVAPNTIETWVRDGQFPKPVVLGDPKAPGSAVRWRKWEVEQWVDGRPREKDLDYEDNEEDEDEDDYDG